MNNRHFRNLAYGVSYRDRPKPFIVKLRRNGRTIYLGSFASYLDARRVAKSAGGPTQSPRSRALLQPRDDAGRFASTKG